MNQSAIGAFVGPIIRTAVIAICSWLVSRNYIDQETVDQNSGAVIGGVVGIVAALAWAIWSRLRLRISWLTALEVPPVTPPERVEELASKKPLSAAFRPDSASTPRPGDSLQP